MDSAKDLFSIEEYVYYDYCEQDNTYARTTSEAYEIYELEHCIWNLTVANWTRTENMDRN